MIVADGVKGPSHKISFIEMTSMHRASEYTFCFLAFLIFQTQIVTHKNGNIRSLKLSIYI
jgi:hypothetical protein